MKNKFDLSACGVQEMKAEEMRIVDGGKKVEYFEYSWTGTGNPLVYAAEGIVNAGKAVANIGIWIWNTCQ